MSEEKFDHLFKLIIVGDSGVGKSSFLYRFAEGNYTDEYVSTIGVDFRFSKMNINGKRVQIQLWDTAGQEKFRAITSSYYRGADAVIICYDISNQESFDNLDEWLSDPFMESTSEKIIVGTKADMIDERVVMYETAVKFAESHNCDFVETSSKADDNVRFAVEKVIQKLVSNKSNAVNKTNTVSITLNNTTAPQPKKKAVANSLKVDN